MALNQPFLHPLERGMVPIHRATQNHSFSFSCSFICLTGAHAREADWFHMSPQCILCNIKLCPYFAQVLRKEDICPSYWGLSSTKQILRKASALALFALHLQFSAESVNDNLGVTCISQKMQMFGLMC